MDTQNLTPASFSILLALAAGEKHGYAIMQEISSSDYGGIRLGPGTLYRSIKQLRDAGLIEAIDENSDGLDERRRYYRLTKRGRAAVRAQAERLASLVGKAANRGLVAGWRAAP